MISNSNTVYLDYVSNISKRISQNKINECTCVAKDDYTILVKSMIPLLNECRGLWDVIENYTEIKENLKNEVDLLNYEVKTLKTKISLDKEEIRKLTYSLEQTHNMLLKTVSENQALSMLLKANNIPFESEILSINEKNKAPATPIIDQLINNQPTSQEKIIESETKIVAAMDTVAKVVPTLGTLVTKTPQPATKLTEVVLPIEAGLNEAVTNKTIVAENNKIDKIAPNVSNIDTASENSKPEKKLKSPVRGPSTLGLPETSNMGLWDEFESPKRDSQEKNILNESEMVKPKIKAGTKDDINTNIEKELKIKEKNSKRVKYQTMKPRRASKPPPSILNEEQTLDSFLNEAVKESHMLNLKKRK